VRIQQDLSIPGHPEIFVAGDTSVLDQDGKPLGGVAQVAIQEGRHAAIVIHRRVAGKPAPNAFRYFDKGTMAVVGPGYAVLESGRVQLKGLLAWLAWAPVHILSLAQVGLRISVFLQWVWTFLTRQRGSRLIVDYYGPVQKTQGAAARRPD
jgi:NADH:ubiquinone reductase (H+-translocating)